MRSDPAHSFWGWQISVEREFQAGLLLLLVWISFTSSYENFPDIVGLLSWGLTSRYGQRKSPGLQFCSGQENVLTGVLYSRVSRCQPAPLISPCHPTAISPKPLSGRNSDHYYFNLKQPSAAIVVSDLDCDRFGPLQLDQAF